MVVLMTSGVVKQTILTISASLAYLSIGLVRGYSSPALPSMQEISPELLPTLQSLSWAGSIPPVGALIGSLMSGPLMHAVGRRRAVLLAAPLWTAAWICVATSTALPQLLVGRFSCGFCVGVVLPAAQVYVSECCSPSVRGRLGSVPSVFMSLGILLSYVMGYWFDWKTLAYCSAGLALIIFIFVLPLPESPIWLHMKKKNEEAEKSLNWLHLPLDHESINLRKVNSNDNEADLPMEPIIKGKRLFTKDIFFSSGVLKPLGIGLALLAFQQVSGIDAIIFYTVEIFQNSGTNVDNHLATIIVGAVQLAANSVSLVLVDKVGRRPLLMLSGSINAVAMASMGAAIYIDLTQSPFLEYLPLISLMVFMVGFSLGFGCIPFLLLGELFASKQRGSLSALAGSFNLLTMFIVIKTYHSLQAMMTAAGTFWMYSGFCVLSVIFVALFVPETKGITLEEIEKHFKKKSPPHPPTPPRSKGERDGKDNLGFQ